MGPRKTELTARTRSRPEILEAQLSSPRGENFEFLPSGPPRFHLLHDRYPVFGTSYQLIDPAHNFREQFPGHGHFSNAKPKVQCMLDDVESDPD